MHTKYLRNQTVKPLQTRQRQTTTLPGLPFQAPRFAHPQPPLPASPSPGAILLLQHPEVALLK